MTGTIKEYNDRSFWKKIRKYGVIAGRKITEPVFILYNCMKDKDTPAKAKVIIAGALAYFIIPSDLICDLSPMIGFTDDLTVILTAFEVIKRYVKPEHILKARKQVSTVFT